MAQTMTRRTFLRSAGGVTLLALTPVARGLFAATDGDATLPLFTALPYIQPGNNSRLVADRETVIIAWQTEDKAADFSLVYNAAKGEGKKANITRSPRLSNDKTRLNYAATLENLPLGRKIFYRVSGNGKTVIEGYFTTRQPRGTRTRFVVLSDNACKNVGNRNVAFQAYLTYPDLVMNAGDSVYDQGRDSEYTQYFFTVFNADKAQSGIGAPLLRSVPYYSVLGNHDINFIDPQTRRGVADFDVDPGALGYYTNMYLPGNGLKNPAQVTPIRGKADILAAFQKLAGARYPQMANYSFDHGDVHFLCLDSNLYIDPTNNDLQKWIASDLQNTDARWKLVVHHHPAFNVGDAHFTEQHMRALSPLFEANGVDFVMNGHEHLYQRSQPLRFAPRDLSKAANLHQSDRLIPGDFTVDRAFDGQKNTAPDGIVYITTGAGGQNLHDAQMNNNPAEWTHQRDNHAAYVARLISDRHSFSLFDVGENEITMTQIDENGAVIDGIRVTKA